MAEKARTYAGILGTLQHLLRALEANKEELSHLEPFRTKLLGLVSEAMEISQLQAALRASKQEASRRLRQLTGDGQRLGHRGAGGPQGALRQPRGEDRRVRPAAVPRPEVEAGSGSAGASPGSCRRGGGSCRSVDVQSSSKAPSRIRSSFISAKRSVRRRRKSGSFS
jgi:hypothetical protein